MKNRSPSSGRAGRVLRRWLVIALPVVVLACSDGESRVLVPAPSAPGASPGVEPLPSTDGPLPTTHGAADPDPVSVPIENDGPGATETNLLTPPCSKDSDCGAGRRCVGGSRTASTTAATDGGAVSKGGVDGADGAVGGTDGVDGGAEGADGGADAGELAAPSPDGGAGLGRCESIDGG